MAIFIVETSATVSNAYAVEAESREDAVSKAKAWLERDGVSKLDDPADDPTPEEDNEFGQVDSPFTYEAGNVPDYLSETVEGAYKA